MLLAFLEKPLGLLILAKILTGRTGDGGSSLFAPPGPAVPSTPFPAAAPESLPSWPKGWCPDVPVPAEVRARAWALLPELWKTGENTRRPEMVGGRWIMFVATMTQVPDGKGAMVSKKSVGAFRSVNCEQIFPEGQAVEQAADAAAKALRDAAIVMNEALKLRGYKQADMMTYKTFQQRAGIGADGYPGTVTMLKLETVLKSAGQQMAPVRVYPWKAGGAYDGVNAPTQAEWSGAGVPATSPIARPAGKPAPGGAPPQAAPPPITPASYTAPGPVSPMPPLTTAYVPASMTPLQVQQALSQLGYKGADGLPLKLDGIIGANTKFATGNFQHDHPPLVVDQIAGPQTKSALAAALAMQKVAPAAVTLPSLIPVAPLVPVVSNVDVQHALNRLHYLGADGKPLVEDGKIGPNSIFAVKAFQREHPPLAVDGVPGPQTKASLGIALSSVAL